MESLDLILFNVDSDIVEQQVTEVLSADADNKLKCDVMGSVE